MRPRLKWVPCKRRDNHALTSISSSVSSRVEAFGYRVRGGLTASLFSCSMHFGGPLKLLICRTLASPLLFKGHMCTQRTRTAWKANDLNKVSCALGSCHRERKACMRLNVPKYAVSTADGTSSCAYRRPAGWGGGAGWGSQVGWLPSAGVQCPGGRQGSDRYVVVLSRQFVKENITNRHMRSSSELRVLVICLILVQPPISHILWRPT